MNSIKGYKTVNVAKELRRSTPFAGDGDNHHVGCGGGEAEGNFRGCFPEENKTDLEIPARVGLWKWNYFRAFYAQKQYDSGGMSLPLRFRWRIADDAPYYRKAKIKFPSNENQLTIKPRGKIRKIPETPWSLRTTLEQHRKRFQ